MAIQVLCPSCKAVSSIAAPNATECPVCHVGYPDDLRESLVLAIRDEEIEPPGPIVFGQWACGIGGILLLFFMLLTPFDIGTYTVNDHRVSGPEFIRIVGVPWAVSAAVLLLIFVGLWRQRAWSRPFIVAFCPLSGGLFATTAYGMGGTTGDAIVVLVSTLIPAGFFAWYLYGTRRPAEYFAFLKRKCRRAPIRTV